MFSFEAYRRGRLHPSASVSGSRNRPPHNRGHAASEKLNSVVRVVQTGPPAPVCFSSPYLPLPSLPIEFVRWFKSTGIPTGYAQLVQESFCGNGGCTYEVTHTYLYELERISRPCFLVQDNCSNVRQLARQGCATPRKYARPSEGDSQNGLEQHCQQPGYPQR
jgi:hypothetical protein